LRRLSLEMVRLLLVAMEQTIVQGERAAIAFIPCFTEEEAFIEIDPCRHGGL